MFLIWQCFFDVNNRMFQKILESKLEQLKRELMVGNFMCFMFKKSSLKTNLLHSLINRLLLKSV
ncbi:hypothetical protein ASG38_16085 [Flavobacterium sp. Leaf359]|nr:hypothetical protein ASG38_16085 [Flavobacterium sp. Leaf359]